MARRASRAVRSIPDTVPPANRTLGWAILEWSLDYLIQPDGPSAGDPWEYSDEQVRILLRWYAIDANGRFVFRNGVLRRMKGWGKDPFLASICAVELCGPCRFGGWDAKGRPVVVQHPAPWVQVAAVSQDQTRNTMTIFTGIFSPAAIDEYKIDLGKTIIYARGSGQIEAVTASPRALEGKRTTLVVKNETQHWLPNNDGVSMAEVIDRNQAKSRDGAGRTIEITNAHLPGEGSVAELTYDALQKEGKIAGLYYDSVESRPIKDLSRLDQVRRGLLDARGDSEWLDVDRLVDEVADPRTPERISRRFYLNQIFTVDAERWLPAGAWPAREDKARAIPAGARVVLGFDGSYNGDATVLIACLIDPCPHLEVVGWWERELGDREWRVPRADVINTMRQACQRWRVSEIAVDQALWQTDLEDLADEGLPVVAFQQRGQTMVDATQRFYELATGGGFTHSGDERLARHIGNAHVRVDSRGPRLSKEHRASQQHIDGAVASVMALHRSFEVEPEKPKPKVVSLAAALRS